MVKKLLQLIWLKCDGRWPIAAYTDNSARGRLNDVGHGYSRGMLMSGKNEHAHYTVMLSLAMVLGCP